MKIRKRAPRPLICAAFSDEQVSYSQLKCALSLSPFFFTSSFTRSRPPFLPVYLFSFRFKYLRSRAPIPRIYVRTLCRGFHFAFSHACMYVATPSSFSLKTLFVLNKSRVFHLDDSYIYEDYVALRGKVNVFITFFFVRQRVFFICEKNASARARAPFMRDALFLSSVNRDFIK